MQTYLPFALSCGHFFVEKAPLPLDAMTLYMFSTFFVKRPPPPPRHDDVIYVQPLRSITFKTISTWWSLKYVSDLAFLLFKQLAAQSTRLVVKTAAPSFQELMAVTADCEWMLKSDNCQWQQQFSNKSDGTNVCCTSCFRLTTLNFLDAPREVSKFAQKCAYFEIDL